jgi:hypothetical protein
VQPPALVRAMGHRPPIVHLADHAPQRPRYLPPDTGDLTCPRLLRALPTGGYGGSLVVVPAHVEDPQVLLVTRDSIRRGWEHVAA